MSDVSCDSGLWISCSAIGVLAGIALAVLPAVKPAAERPLRLADAAPAEATGIAPRIEIVEASPAELKGAPAARRYLLTPTRIASVARLRAPEPGGRLPRCHRCPRSTVAPINDLFPGSIRQPGNPAGGKPATR